MPETITEVDRQAGAVVTAAVSPFVIGLVARDDDGRAGRMLGTGTSVRFRNVNIVLTAEHTLRNSTLQDTFFIPPPRGGFSLAKSIAEPSEYGMRIQPRVRWLRDQILDVAALVVESDVTGIQFFHLSEDSAAPGIDRSVAVCGYPLAKAKPVLFGELFGYAAFADFQGAAIMDRSLLARLQPSQFAIDYPQSAGIPPQGYSGAMVWYDRAGCYTLEELHDHLNLGAAGIVTDHWADDAALACTKIEDIVRFLQTYI